MALDFVSWGCSAILQALVELNNRVTDPRVVLRMQITICAQTEEWDEDAAAEVAPVMLPQLAQVRQHGCRFSKNGVSCLTVWVSERGTRRVASSCLRVVFVGSVQRQP